MAIIVADETVFPLTEVPDHVPTRRGRKIHKATSFRWKDMGLEVICVGGVLHTSTQALQRFFERRTGDRYGKPVTVEPRTPAARTRSHAKADRELDALGV
jgi:hypothetical protein